MTCSGPLDRKSGACCKCGTYLLSGIHVHRFDELDKRYQVQVSRDEMVCGNCCGETSCGKTNSMNTQNS